MRDPLRRFLMQEANQTTGLQDSQAELIQLLRRQAADQHTPSAHAATAPPSAVTGN